MSKYELKVTSKGSQKHEKLKTALLPYWRERPPTTYSVTFESFGKMMELVNNGYYESLPFTVDGINWYVVFVKDHYNINLLPSLYMFLIVTLILFLKLTF